MPNALPVTHSLTHSLTHTFFFSLPGPFEAGFGEQQADILANLFGCGTGEGYVDAGIDTLTAEAIVAASCNVVLPRFDGADYISLLDECGG